MKVHISLGFALLFSGLYFFDDSGLFGAIVTGIFVHELGHYLAIRSFGGRVERISFRLTGLSMTYNEGDMTYGKGLVIALAGPLASLFLAIGASLIGKNFGSLYPCYIAGSSLIFFAFNMMPVRQLDGGRVLYALFSMFCKVNTVERIMSVVSCAAILCLLIAGVILLIISGTNASLLLAAIWLFIQYIKYDFR